MTIQFKKGRKLMNIALIIIILVLSILVLRFIIQRVIYQNAVKDMEISEIQVVTLNGIPQKILVEEKTKDLPILIMVHGGPGLPVPFGVGFRGQYPQLSENFLLVQWDHYGTGINYSSDTSLTIDDYVIMLHDLVTDVESKYPGRNLFLFGMSWGTILTTKIANLIPDKIDGVIAYGQFTNIPIWKQAMYDKLQVTGLSAKEKEALENAMSDPSAAGFKSVLKEASAKTSLYYYKGKEASNLDFYMHCFHLMISPDYSLSDAMHAYSNPSGDALMYNHVFNIDMSNEQQSVQVPFLILQGEDDLITPVSHNKELVSKNSFMSMKVFKNAGHIPTNQSYDEMFGEIISFKNRIMSKG